MNVRLVLLESTPIELAPLEITISDEEILADLLYPAAADGAARRRP